MGKRIRYTRQNVATNTFYQMPKFLFYSEFSNMTNDARVLYMLLRNRHELSLKNGWFDASGAVFIHYKREDMRTMLNLSKNTVTKLMKELKTLELIEEEKQGLNKPNRIYLLIPDDPSTLHEIGESSTKPGIERCPNSLESGVSKNGIQETQILTPSYTENKYNKTSYISVQSSLVNETTETDQTESEASKIETYTQMIKDNISYTDFAQRPFDIGLVDDFITIIIDTIFTQAPSVRIGKEGKPISLVQSIYMKLAYKDIEHAINQFQNVAEKITHKKQYIRTLLYNCKLEGEAHYTNEYAVGRWE